MNAINSYLRHLIVTGITLLISNLKLPLEGADKFADAIALIVIGTITWAIVKYAPPGVSKFLGLSIFTLLAGLFLNSCAGLEVTARSPYGEISTDQKGRIVVIPRPIVIPQK
jgi:membrane-bound ClpP family serine protease